MIYAVYIVFERLPSFEAYPVAVFTDRDEAEKYAQETDRGFVSLSVHFYSKKKESKS